ncbi:hypothetical protein RFI_16350, partial [Reticulomyxa filosa]
MWPPPDEIIDNEEEQRKPERIEETLQRVIQCALDIQEKYGQMQLKGAGAKETDGNDSNDKDEIQPLRVKLGIGVGGTPLKKKKTLTKQQKLIDTNLTKGTCGLLVVGGVKNRCEYLVTGEAFAQAFGCEATCLPKQIVVSARVAQLMQHKFKMEPIEKTDNRLNANIINKTMNDTLAELLKSYIPSAVVPHLLMPSTLWAGELRQVTIMFLSLPFNSKKLQVLDSMLVKHINATIQTLQDMVYLYQGSLNKFLVDDKGSTVMAIFGLPPVAHVNDPERAVLTALELQVQLKKLFAGQYEEEVKKYEEDLAAYEKQSVGNPPAKPTNKTQAAIANKRQKFLFACLLLACIGITCGTVFLGLVGNAGSRREYSVLGDKVNLAARLMAKAKEKPDIYEYVLCDESVRDSCQSSSFFSFDDKGAPKLKGFEKPVPCFTPKLKSFEVESMNGLSEELLESGDSHLVSLLISAVEQMHKQGVGKIALRRRSWHGQ